jgi:two-component system, OmpR family, response regulator
MRGMKLLLAVAEPQPAKRIKRGLEAERHRVVSTGDGYAALSTALGGSCDVLLVESRLGQGLGAFCGRLRADGLDTPVLGLTADANAAHIAAMLDAGADDVVPLSVAMPELLARVRALRRRDNILNGELRAGDLMLDVAMHAAVRGHQVIELTVKEFQLLELLLRRQGEVVSREEIVDAVWRGERFESNVVDIYIHYLRNKVDRRGKTQLIHTVRGAGYTLKA